MSVVCLLMGTVPVTTLALDQCQFLLYCHLHVYIHFQLTDTDLADDVDRTLRTENSVNHQQVNDSPRAATQSSAIKFSDYSRQLELYMMTSLFQNSAIGRSRSNRVGH